MPGVGLEGGWGRVPGLAHYLVGGGAGGEGVGDESRAQGVAGVAVRVDAGGGEPAGQDRVDGGAADRAVADGGRFGHRPQQRCRGIDGDQVFPDRESLETGADVAAMSLGSVLVQDAQDSDPSFGGVSGHEARPVQGRARGAGLAPGSARVADRLTGRILIGLAERDARDQVPVLELLLRVGYAVLDRIIRTNAMRVPVPERDLVLDTGISDRATIRRTLRWLHDRVVGVLDVEAFDPRQPRSSSFEFEIPPAAVGEGGVPQIPPPSSHTPLPRMPLDLPGTAWLLMRALAQNPRRWWDLNDLMAQCQLDEAAGVPIGGKRLRGVRAVLAELAQHGLARCDADGRWAAADIPASDVRERDVSWDGLVMQIQSERDAYRAGGQSRWQVARAASIKRERAKQRAWWDGLDPVERAARHATWAAGFDRLSVDEQYQVKADLARRSEVEGISPAVRHQRWIYSMDPDDLAMIASERAVRFASIPLPRQVAAVRAWEAYRREFGVPRGSWQIGDRRRDRSDVADDARDWSSVGGR